MDPHPHAARNNMVLLLKLLLLACVVFMLALGLMPVYDALCRLTGFGRSPYVNKVVPAASRTGTPVTMRFDITVPPGLALQVRALTPVLAVRAGESVRVDYEITNTSPRRINAQATLRYLPAALGRYVKKPDCSCLAPQTFAPGETRRVPLLFVMDDGVPDAVADMAMTLSMSDVQAH